jgi:hypothetical protein
MVTIFSLIGLAIGLAMILGMALTFVGCYLLMLNEGVRFVAKKAGHRWVTLGLLLVVLSVVAGIAWNWLPARVLIAVMVYFMPVIRLLMLVWSKLKSKYTLFEQLYAGLLFLVSAFSIGVPMLMIPRAVWQSLGPILKGS